MSYRRIVLRIAAAVLAVLVIPATGCVGAEFYEREKLEHAAMQFDGDGGWVSVRDKLEAAREGGFGGFGGARAGGCACQ